MGTQLNIFPSTNQPNTINEPKAYIPFLGILSIIIINGYRGGARGVMVIVVGNGHGDTSSNPRRD